MLRSFGFVFLVLCQLAPSRALAQDDVPADLRAAVIIRSLGFERGVRSGEGPVRLLVATDAEGRIDAARMVDAFTTFARRTTLNGRTVQVDRVDVGETSEVTGRDPHVVYFASGMRPATARRIAQALGPGRITVCGSVALLSDGCVMGVERFENRPRPVVNVTAARSRAVDLDARLLRLARIIR